MNKKFSTLLAGVALLGAMSANAGNPVTSLQKTGNGLYQLKAAGGVLAMTPEGALKLEATTESANLASTLWCVEVTEEGYGKAPIFDLQTKLPVSVWISSMLVLCWKVWTEKRLLIRT